MSQRERNSPGRAVGKATGKWGATALAGALLTIFALSGCSTAQIDSIPKQFGGLPDSAPKRAEKPPDYPAVHDMPPPRAATVLDEEQQKRMEAELIAVRNRQPGQEKNRVKEAQKKAVKDKAKSKDAANPKTRPARQPAAVADAPVANPPAASPWPVPPR